MKKKYTITIGIPAFNEEANIAFLLYDILKQESQTFNLKKIIVYSDGSTDQTVQAAKSVPDARIVVIEGKIRGGIAFGLNAIIQNTDTQALVILNADIKIKDAGFLEKILWPVIVGHADLVSGALEELAPKTLLEKVLRAGAQYKKTVFEQYNGGNNLYTCIGPARAFSKNFYRSARFQRSVADDMYSYLFCLSKGYKYYHERRAVVFYKLPSTLKDHFRQSSRFFHSPRVMTAEFGKDFVSQEVKLPAKIFFKEGVKFFFRYPVLFTGYIGVTLFSKLTSILKAERAGRELWEIAATSKNLK